MPFDPKPLTAETLDELLKERSERPGLDYKRACDLRSTSDRVELAKDIGAMQIAGGYIVIGADDQGTPVDGFTAEMAAAFDEAVVRNAVKKYIPAGFDIKTAPIELDEHHFALICVAPHPDGLVAFLCDGTYEAKGKPRVAFRAGDVYSRHGTQSTRWSQDDVRRVREDMRRREREAARDEFQQALEGIQERAMRVAGSGSAPVSTMTWDLDLDALADNITEQLRRGDLIPVTQLLKSAPRIAAGYLHVGDRDRLSRLLDSIVSVAARLLWLEQSPVVHKCLDAMVGIFRLGFDGHGQRTPSAGGVQAAELHFEIVCRVVALGGLANREGAWELVDRIAVESAGLRPENENWIHYASVHASRAGLLRHPERRSGQNLLVIAADHVSRLSALRMDLPDVGEGWEGEVTNSLCRFDMQAAFASLNQTLGRTQSRFTLWSAWWHSHRTDPVALDLVISGPTRAVFFPRSDDDLALALRVVADHAHAMARGIDGWDGFWEQPVINFLHEHAEAAG